MPSEQIVTRAEELAACCQHLAENPVLGFDTEFIGEDTFHPRLCLVQVATAERLFVVDPLAAGPLERFWELVADPARVVVVHAGREEIRMCQHGCNRRRVPDQNVDDPFDVVEPEGANPIEAFLELEAVGLGEQAV